MKFDPARLYHALLNTGLQTKDNPLYQVIYQLISSTISINSEINTLISDNGSSSNSIITIIGSPGQSGEDGEDGLIGSPGARGIDGANGMVPYSIAANEIFTIPESKQALFAMNIDNEGILEVDGFLIEVDGSNSGNSSITTIITSLSEDGISGEDGSTGPTGPIGPSSSNTLMIFNENIDDENDFNIGLYGLSNGQIGILPTINGGTGLSSYTLGDIIYSSALNILAKLPGNITTTQKFLSQIGDGIISAAPTWQLVPSVGSLVFFFYNTASSIGGAYLVMKTPASVGASQTITTAGLSGGNTTLANFATLSGVPNITFVPAGVCTCYITAKQTAGTKTTQLFAEFYQRNLGGTETLLATSALTIDITTIDAAYIFQGAIPASVVFLSTDRIVCKIIATVSGGGSAPTVVLTIEGVTAARSESPSATVDATNFVPYSGATANVDLGSKTLTTTSVVTAGSIAATTLVAVSAGTLTVAAPNGTLQLAVFTTADASGGYINSNGNFFFGSAKSLFGGSFLATDAGFYATGNFYLATDGLNVVPRSSSTALGNNDYPWGALRTAGAARMSNFGAGVATFDASGNISSVSDERLKDIVGPLVYGLNEILALSPILYHYKKESGLEIKNIYAGFSAQNVLKYIPQAVGKDLKGFYTFNDRPVLAAVVNAIKTIQFEIDKLREKIGLDKIDTAILPILNEEGIIISRLDDELLET